MRKLVTENSTISIDEITGTSKIGVVLKNKKYIVINRNGHYFLVNSYLCTVFNNVQAKSFTCKKEMIKDIQSKHSTSVFAFDTTAELIQWFIS